MTDILHTDYRSILRLALPVSAGTFMQFLVVLTDNYFLSRTSDVALNGAGNAGVLYITLAMIGAGFCNTGQILIARRMGEGRQDETLRILATGLRVAIVVGTLLILPRGARSQLRVFLRVPGRRHGRRLPRFHGHPEMGLPPLLPRDDAQCLLHGDRPIRILMWAMITTGTVNVLGDALLIGGVAPCRSERASGLGQPRGRIHRAWFSSAMRCTTMAVPSGRPPADPGPVEGVGFNSPLPMIAQLTLTLGTWSMFFFLVEQVGVIELKVSHIARNFFMLAFVVSQGIQQTTRTFISGLLGSRTTGRTDRGHAAALRGEPVRHFPDGPRWPPLPRHARLALLRRPHWLEAASRTLPVIFFAMLIYSGSSVMLSTIQGSGHTRPALIIEVSALVVYTALAVTLTLDRSPAGLADLVGRMGLFQRNRPGIGAVPPALGLENESPLTLPPVATFVAAP